MARGSRTEPHRPLRMFRLIAPRSLHGAAGERRGVRIRLLVYKGQMMRATVRAAAKAPAWKITNATMGGSWRFNAALRHASDTSKYPYNLEVVIPLAQTGPRGHHGTADAEEKVIEVVADRAVLAGVLTSGEDQRFEFYTDSPDWTAKIQGQLRAATGIGTLRANCDPDAQWYIYRDLRGRDQVGPKTLIVLGLFLVSVVLWIPVQGVYGQAWGWGELAVSIILIAARALPRTNARWSPKYPALILGARAVAVSAVLFPLLALTRVPAWIGLITSLLAGAALVAGVWVARLKYGQGWPVWLAAAQRAATGLAAGLAAGPYARRARVRARRRGALPPHLVGLNSATHRVDSGTRTVRRARKTR